MPNRNDSGISGTERRLKNVLITGGAGFIGSNFIRLLFSDPAFDGHAVNFDALTYAGNPANLSDISEVYGQSDSTGASPRYVFVRGDVCDQRAVKAAFEEYDIDTVVHFAAESHVDRSIHGPLEFVRTNVMGTAILLETARELWRGRGDVLYHHVSTDEVFGSLGDAGAFTEETPYDPRSPYSASKASSDHLVRAYWSTYGLPATMSNCSNNYGPYQFPEKLIPLMIRNIKLGRKLPVYGDGGNVRDWLYVDDHNRAILEIARKGRLGESYNIGGESERKNIELVRGLCAIMAGISGESEDRYLGLIEHVRDRPGHDRRYAMDCSKIKRELDWRPKVAFAEGLEKTVRWYLDNEAWVEAIESGDYARWIEKNYTERGHA